MPTTTPARSTVTWGTNRTANSVGVRRLADTAENRRKLQAEAAKDRLPSAVVDMGQDVVLLSGRQLETASKIARTLGPVLESGGKAKVDGAEGAVLFTDDGLQEIDAKDVIVAVIDSGLDVNHPAFAGRIVKPYNSTNGSADVTDKNGHGTHVAGIIAGAWGVDPKAGGVASSAKIMPIKAGDGGFSSGDLVKAIRYAVDNGAKVINMSLGGPMMQPSVHRALKYAEEQGVVVLVATGNDSKDKVSFPGRYDEVLGVGSSKDGKRSPFSNGGDHIDLSAPGERIYATLPTGKSEIGDRLGTNTYGAISGTSMATPYAAGAAALVIAQHPDWTAAQVKAHMTRAVNDLGAPGWDKDFGYGEVNLFKAAFGENLPEVPRAVPQKKGFLERILSFFGLY